ncbi:Calumenin [Echinococcus granulosus]|uniref:Reticulocalbin n=1 Tax=Echinococcus granulosus TaxID=6210 RepID=A0A068X133_ECHGR|nr:Calumenin [Echinococcus granulosus]CDS23681.1 reticulocalbin [Echinococcus granulosus]
MTRHYGLLIYLLVSQAISYSDDLHKHPFEAKDRLARLFDSIDTFHDGELDSNELAAWIDSVFSRTDRKSAKEMLRRLDIDKDGYVSMAEYLSDNFGYTLQEIDAIRRDESNESQQILEAVDDEIERFTRADMNGDERLDARELAGFNSPYHYPHMAPYVVGEMLHYQDYNGDGRLGLEEYLANSKDNEILEYEKGQFSSIDKNGDGYADAEELRLHYIEESGRYARNEADHLLAESDLNSDGKLTRAEVSEAYETWLDSPATDHGELLRDVNLDQLSLQGGARDEL